MNDTLAILFCLLALIAAFAVLVCVKRKPVPKRALSGKAWTTGCLDMGVEFVAMHMDGRPMECISGVWQLPPVPRKKIVPLRPRRFGR